MALLRDLPLTFCSPSLFPEKKKDNSTNGTFIVRPSSCVGLVVNEEGLRRESGSWSTTKVGDQSKFVPLDRSSTVKLLGLGRGSFQGRHSKV